jgi:phenylalanyl-tRNA synthetase beta chain
VKFSYQWLSELTGGLRISPEEAARLITIHTAESEGVEKWGALLEGASPAVVRSVQPIEGAKNRLAVVDTELYGERTVVCGAPNCREGLRTVWVPLGRKKLNGIESDGMLASGAELGINKDHDGIVELAATLDLQPDAVIEVDNKSLTHRPDLWGHYGMARELSAILGLPLKDPVTPQSAGAADGWPVQVRDAELCPRFCAVLFENVTVGPSPQWLQYRLSAIGLNSINNIVDVTNLIMAELPQPTHAFDADKVTGSIIVRRASEGEKLLALDRNEYTLSAADGVVADESGALSLAGVMGGDTSAITSATTRVLFESANWHPIIIRRTSSRLKLRTDASMRFEKALDPENSLRAIHRAIELIPLVSPGARVASQITDVYSPLPKVATIALPLEWLEKRLGRKVGMEETTRILRALSFGVEESNGVLQVSVPSWRATKDISLPEDLVEEIGRVIGYGNIAPEPPRVATQPMPANEERAWFARVRSVATQQGFTETYNYSFLSEEAVSELGFSVADHLAVANPIAENQSLMRRSLLPGLLSNIRENLKHFDQFRLFEIGREIHPRKGELPQEEAHLAAAYAARSGDGAEGLAELQRLALCLLPGCETLPAKEARAFEHPRRIAELRWRGEVVGRLYELHPNLTEGRAAILDLNMVRTQELAGQTEVKFKPLRRFPGSEFDLSVLAEGQTTTADILGVLRNSAGAHTLSIHFLRVYPLSDGKRSITCRCTVGAAERTLTSEEINAEREALLQGLARAGYSLR